MSKIFTYKSKSKLHFINKNIAYKFGGTEKKPMEFVSHNFQNGIGTVEFSQDITKIIDGVFAFNNDVTEVELPDTVTLIGAHSFGSTTNLRKVIARGVNTIEYKAFNDCHELREVDFGTDVLSIQAKAFENCIKLNNVTIGTRTSIKENAFGSCNSLTNITLLEGVTTIPNYLFRKCEKLEVVTFPSTVHTIGMKVFSGCKKIKEVYLNSIVPPTVPKEYTISGGINNNNVDGLMLFHKANIDAKIYVPFGTLEAYSTAKGWSDYVDYFVESPEVIPEQPEDTEQES